MSWAKDVAAARGYHPIDHWLEIPRVRILRRLRWFSDGITAADLYDLLELPSDGSRKDRVPERNRFNKALEREVKAGTVRVRIENGVRLYSLMPGIKIEAPNDDVVLEDDAEIA